MSACTNPAWSPKIMKTLLTIFLLTGCASAVNAYDERGNYTIFLECARLSDCYRKAKEICPHGYSVAQLGRVENEMYVACKRPDRKEKVFLV